MLLAKVFNRQAYELERYRAENARQVELQVRQAMTGQSFFAVVQTFLGITPALVYLVAGFLIATGSGVTLTAGTIVALSRQCHRCRAAPHEPEVPPAGRLCSSIRPPVCQSDRVINPRPSVKLVRSPRLTSRASYAYAAVAHAASRLIFTAGACPLDESGAIVEVGDVAGQAERTMTNLRIALQAAQAGLTRRGQVDGLRRQSAP